MNVLTGIDLPLSPTCGSLILCEDLYQRWPGEVRFFGIAPQQTDFLQHPQTLVWPEHPARLAPERQDYIQDLARRIAGELRAQPDVYHMHHMTFGATRAALEVLDSKTPVVAICHGTDLLIARHDASHRETVRRALTRANITIFPTQAMEREARHITTEFSSRVIPWGLPPEAYQPRQSAWSPGLRVLYAGRLTANKGAQTVLDAVALRPDWSLTLIGPHQAWTQLRTPPNAHLLDFMPRQRLWEAFEDHDVLVLSTTQLEAFGLTAMEACARGLPVVYADVSGLEEVFGDAAVAYTPGDPQELRQALEHIQHELPGYSRRGMERAAHFTMDRTRAGFVQASREARDFLL